MASLPRMAILASTPVLVVVACGLFDEDDFECPHV